VAGPASSSLQPVQLPSVSIAERGAVAVKATVPAAMRAMPFSTKALVKMIELCLEQVVGPRPIFAAGVQMKPADVVKPDFLLPALLITAAEMWNPVVVRKGGTGGFHLHLARDPSALLGFKVVEVHPSAPFLFFLPISHLFRTSLLSDDECCLDSVIQIFIRWLVKNKQEADAVDDLDVRVALSITDE
jgi:hypothetical protein